MVDNIEGSTIRKKLETRKLWKIIKATLHELVCVITDTCLTVKKRHQASPYG